MIRKSDIPALPRGVRTHFDSVRNANVLLGPERVLMLDQISIAVLSRVNGQDSVEKIVDDLAASFEAPRDVVEVDVLAYLTELVEKRLLDVSDG